MVRTRFIAILVMCLAPFAAGDILLPRVLGDHMVLQQQTEAAIWGWARAGQTVHVRGSWMENDRSGQANEIGRWLVRIPTPEAGGPYSIEISGDSTITINDVLIGEVWIGSGQSNMEMPVSRLRPEDIRKALENSDDPQLRLFRVPRAIALQERADTDARQGGNGWGNPGGQEVHWQTANASSVAPFSAAAYFFAQRLRDDLGVPVGVIEAAWGGTRIEAWMSPEALTAFDEFHSQLEMIHAVTTNPGSRASLIEKRIERWWSDLDSGAPEHWQNADFDDSGWKTMNLPTTLKDDGLDQFDGVVYFRREVNLPEGWEGKPVRLSLGPIDDYDDVWFNGVHVGGIHEPNQWNVPRKYDVPGKAVRGGKNVIAVRMLDTAGPGGINGSDGLLNIQKEDMLVPVSGPWKYARGPKVSELPAQPSGVAVNANTPTALYHGMITPILPYSVRGAIWYQGESNVGRAARYADLFPAMIKDWRRAFENNALSFYFVQIAPFHYRNDTGLAARLRDSQRTTLSLDHTGMAVTMDIGNPNDIHPKDKQQVGDRLARWALAKDYGRSDVVYSGPLYKRFEIDDGRIRLFFEHTNGGLVAQGGPLTHFTIAGADKKFVPAQATIDGNSIIVWSSEVPEPVAVRYGWGAADEPNLFNGAGLPASSFRTDDWD